MVHLRKLHSALLEVSKQHKFLRKATQDMRHEQVQRRALGQITRNLGPGIPAKFECFSCSAGPPFCSDFQLKNKWLSNGLWSAYRGFAACYWSTNRSLAALTVHSCADCP